MIAKATSISSTRASIAYGKDKEKGAETIYSHLLTSEDPTEVTAEFKSVQALNCNCKRNTLSFIISPTIEDGQKLDRHSLKEITGNFMKQMKLGDRQAIAFVHLDKAHKHIHLYVNRIDLNGKAYNDSFVGKRSQLAAERTAKELGLTTVKEVQISKALESKQIRQQIRNIHIETMEKVKPKNLDQYIKAMKTLEVNVIPSINKSKQLQGFRFEFKGQSFKASEVHRSMSGGKLLSAIDNNTYKSVINKGTQSVFLKGVSLPLSTNLITAIGKKLITKAIKKSIQIGMGI
jgi:hypothetical protein